MPRKITAFNTDINPSEVISHLEKNIYTAIKISKYLIQASAVTLTTGFVIINELDIELSPKNIFLSTIYSAALIGSYSYALILCSCTEPTKSSLIQEIYNINDAFVALAEYTRDYFELSGESKNSDID